MSANVELDWSEDPAELRHRMVLLGGALAQVLIAAGMVRADACLTGPQLLLAADDFCAAPNAEFHQTVLAVRKRVEREDGRFYIPLARSAIRVQDARSMIVARVASDAFDSVDEADRFALDLASAWNQLYRHFD